MILSSLVKYYDEMASRGKIPPLGYNEAPVSYALRLSETGELKAIETLKQIVKQGKKDVERPMRATVPAPVVRSSGVAANFLCDTSGYLLGIDQKGKPERTAECFEASKSLHLSILSEVDSKMARAIYNYFTHWRPEEAEGHPALAGLSDDYLTGVNLIFMLDADFAHEDLDVCIAWDRHYAVESGEERICLVQGVHAPVAVIHPKIKGVKGAQSVGASLVSFNANAFESYGGDGLQGINAPVSRDAAFKYASALNQLISDPKHRSYLGEMTFIYWSEDGNEDASSWISSNFSFQSSDNADQNAALHVAFDRIVQGLPPVEGIDLQCPFCILCLAPNAARISVRFFLRDSFGAFARRLQEHYRRLDIIRPSFDSREFILIPALLDEVKNPYSTTMKELEEMTGSLIRDILSGYRYPPSLFASLLMRVRAERKITRVRAAIAKAYLLRNYPDRQIEEACTMALNEQSENRAYLLGRLFAMLEQSQNEANPGIKATIRDRYFNSACSTPASVFPTLLRLNTNHLRKLDPGPKVYLERQITEIVGKLPSDGLPARLNLEEQGLFILGFYHQQQKRYTKKQEENGNG